jgi:hypothetical protein
MILIELLAEQAWFTDAAWAGAAAAHLAGWSS